MINKFFRNQDSRSLIVFKNIGASFIIKGISIGINLLLVPLTITYLTAEKYGVWLTISSLFTWINFFDVGLGHGLRNKLAEAIANNNAKRAKTLVSTAYFSISILCFFLFIFFEIINSYYLNWNKILNIPQDDNDNFKLIASILFFTFSLQFVLQLINSILLSVQQSYRVSMFNAVSNLLILAGITTLKHYTNGSLFYISCVFTIIPVITMLCVNIYYFTHTFKTFSPSIKHFDYSCLKDIMGLGVKFFIIQISALVFFETTNILITQYFNPTLVTTYNIAYRYFGIITMLFSIISTPYWSAYTEAYTLKDYHWMVKSIKKLFYLWTGVFSLAVFMLLFSSTAYQLWIQGKVEVEFKVSLFMMIYNSLSTLGTIYIMVINGTGKIKTQMLFGIIGMILFIPLSYLFSIKLNLGLIGIILSTIICSSYSFIIAPFEVKKILSNLKPQ